ncbi:MAG TPA: hypothetical protein VFM70_04315 [Salinimicrobium sp.]|nr:hypothetical protein [Salinimicrobium sp.]
MKTIFFKIALFLFLVPAVSGASTTTETGKYTKTKKVTRSFDVNSNATLFVDNSYGNINITSWDKNVIGIEVFIKTNGNDEQKVKEALDAIEISFSNSSSLVKAITSFEKKDSSWWDIFTGGSNINREINYLIKMPVTNHVDLSNDYGSINIDKLSGNAKINCDYGKMIIGELLGNENYLNFDYTRNTVIGYIKKAKINADYSEFEIEEIGYLDLNADYTSSKIKKVTELKFNCDYGDISVGKVRKLVGVGDYLGTKIGEVHGNVSLNLDYGSVDIEKLTSETGIVKIESDYTGIKIGYDAALAFNFHIQTSYGGIKGLKGLEISTEDKSSYETDFKGYNVSNGSGNVIEINSNYGSVTFERK